MWTKKVSCFSIYTKRSYIYTKCSCIWFRSQDLANIGLSCCFPSINPDNFAIRPFGAAVDWNFIAWIFLCPEISLISEISLILTWSAYLSGSTVNKTLAVVQGRTFVMQGISKLLQSVSRNMFPKNGCL